MGRTRNRSYKFELPEQNFDRLGVTRDSIVTQVLQQSTFDDAIVFSDCEVIDTTEPLHHSRVHLVLVPVVEDCGVT